MSINQLTYDQELGKKILMAESSNLYNLWPFLQRHSLQCYNEDYTREKISVMDHPMKESYHEGSFSEENSS